MTSLLKKLLGIALPLVFAGGVSAGNPVAVGAAPALIKTVSGKPLEVAKLNRHIAQTMEELGMPGLSMAVINDGKVVLHQVAGYANGQTKSPVKHDSLFEAASLSKPLFAYFAMKMHDQGVLDLDRPLHTVLPHPGIAKASQADFQTVTARMILSHSSGFPNFSNGKEIALPFKPGTGFEYSGEGYQYLAAVIGKLHGVGWKADFNDIFVRTVTKGLHMAHSSFLWNDYLASHKVYGHADGKPTANDTGGWSGKTFNAYSSLHSEAREYAQFIVAMINRKGLSEASMSDMLREQNHFAQDNPMRKETGQTGWGLGFAQKPTPNGIMHLHTGNNHDFQSYAMFVPDQKYGLVLFTNSDKMLAFLKRLEVIMEQQF